MYKKDFPLILVMIVPADTDRTEFEPDAVWDELPNRPLKVMVRQSVRRSGNTLIGATDTFQESFAEVMDDRFVQLYNTEPIY